MGLSITMKYTKDLSVIRRRGYPLLRLFLSNTILTRQNILASISYRIKTALKGGFLLVMDTFRTLTLNQISFILRLWEQPAYVGYAEGKTDGKIIDSLREKGLVQPFGRDGKKQRWQLVKSAFPAGVKEELLRMEGLVL